MSPDTANSNVDILFLTGWILLECVPCTVPSRWKRARSTPRVCLLQGGGTALGAAVGKSLRRCCCERSERSRRTIAGTSEGPTATEGRRDGTPIVAGTNAEGVTIAMIAGNPADPAGIGSNIPSRNFITCNRKIETSHSAFSRRRLAHEESASSSAALSISS